MMIMLDYDNYMQPRWHLSFDKQKTLKRIEREIHRDTDTVF